MSIFVIGIRICKIMAILSVAILFIIISSNNIFDYDSNFIFLKHVFEMDTVFPGNACMWRAIHSKIIQHLAYLLIIGIELSVGVLCVCGGVLLFLRRGASEVEFNKAKELACYGLMMGFVLMVFVFMAIGGEWFMMWQSQTWNGMLPAFRMAAVCGITFIFLIHSDAKCSSESKKS